MTNVLEHLLATSMPLTLGVFAVVALAAGLALTGAHAPLGSWRRRAGAPAMIALLGGGTMVGLITAMYLTHRSMAANVVEQIDGVAFLRPHDGGVHLQQVSESLGWVLALQAAAVVVALGSAAAVLLSVWLRGRQDSLVRRWSARAATAAVVMPLLIGGLACAWLLDTLLTDGVHSGAWSIWNEAEAARWAVLGASAGMMMVASPIVVAAAERAILVGPRLYAASRWILAAGVLAWAGSQLLVEDLHREPLRQDSMRHTQRLDLVAPMPRPMDLFPPAATCLERGSTRALAETDLVLVVDRWGLAHDPDEDNMDADAWKRRMEVQIEETGYTGTERVLVLVDGRAAAEHVRPFINAAAELSDDMLVLAAHVQRHRTLSLGTVHQRHDCVAAKVDAASLSRDADRWVGTDVRWRSVAERLAEQAQPDPERS